MVDHVVLSHKASVRSGYRLLCPHSSMDRVFGYEPEDWRSSRHEDTKCLCSSNWQSVCFVIRMLQVRILPQALKNIVMYFNGRKTV